jgi:flagellar hook-associated protein 2
MGVSGVTSNPSGIDDAGLISQLVYLQYETTVTPVQDKLEAYQTEVSAYSTVKSDITSLKTAADALNESDDFSEYKSSSTDEDVATIEGDSGADEGDYTVQIYHLGTAEKLGSTDGLITSTSETLSDLGISSGTININGTDISIDSSSSVKEMCTKINNATDSNDNSLGVKATLLKISASNYRMVLTATKTDTSTATEDYSNTVTYSDTSGSILQSMGFITDASGSKDYTTQQLSSTDNVQSAAANIVSGDTVSFTGTDHDGNTISYSKTTTGAMTDSQFLSAIEDAYKGMVTASFDSGGKLVITDNISGESDLSFSLTSAGSTAVSSKMTTVTSGTQGANVLTAGSNAYFSVDGLDMSAAGNEVKDFIPNTTIKLLSTSYDTDISLSLTANDDAIASKIQTFVDAYNTLYDYITKETKYADPNDSTTSDGDLAGDETAKSILDQITNIFQKQFNTGSNYETLASIGITTDSSTGDLSLDKDTLDTALSNDFTGVMNLFVTTGTSSDSSTTYGKSSSSTSSGDYTIKIGSDGTYSICLTNLIGTSDESWSTGTRSGDIVSFSDGSADGLMITSPDNSSLYGTDITFSYSRGCSDSLIDTCDSTTESYDGTIANHLDYLNKLESDANDRITTLTASCDAYKERLTKQYSAMETMILKLQTAKSTISSL